MKLIEISCVVCFQMVEIGKGGFLEYNIYLTRGWGPNMVSLIGQSGNTPAIQTSENSLKEF